jgi:hypothetical protein
VSRSGYIEDDGDDVLATGRWRGAVASAIRGKNGQAFLRELLDALDAMPVKELIAHELKAEGQYCTLGVLGEKRGIAMESLDPEEYEQVACAFKVNPKIVQEIVWFNDEHIDDWKWEEIEICGPVRPFYPEWGKHTTSYRVPDLTAPARRWKYMRDWVAKQLKETQQ